MCCSLSRKPTTSCCFEMRIWMDAPNSCSSSPSDFKEPYGLAYRDGEVLVADHEGIWTVKYRDSEVRADPGYKPRPAAEVPEGEREPKQPMDHQALTTKGVFGGPGGHSSRSLAIDPKDGTLYVGVGSTGNIGEEPLPRASIQAFNADGSDQRTFAGGMRNPIGMEFHPDTGELWAVVQDATVSATILFPIT